MIFAKITEAYRLGKEYARVTDNLFWFGNEMNADGSEYLHLEVYDWERTLKNIEATAENFGLLELIAFEIGDH